MDESRDFHSQGPSQDYIFSDIDETLEYPWQETPSNAPQSPLASAIDPRLYGDPFSNFDIGQPDQETGSYAEDNEDVDITGAQEMLEDSGWSGGSRSDDYDRENSSSDEEMADLDEAGVEDDDEAASLQQRRHRRGHGPFFGRFGARGGKGIKRGPRRPLEPSPEFKVLHSEATTAFIDGDYDRAIDLVKRAIQVNPEMFAAHSLLSEIFLAQGEKDKALTALFSGAHTRPKDAIVWSKVAKLILDRAGDDRHAALNDVIYCYSRVIEIDPKNYNARFQRATIYRELGYNGRAATEYERILKELPHNTRALRHLAETYIDLNDVQTAIDHYMDSVQYYMSLDPEDKFGLSWSDINIIVELFSYAKRYDEGLQVLKSLSRWLLDRKEDDIWDQYPDDDREWDVDDFPRRITTSGFEPGLYLQESYGLGLPLELRIKLGVFRLKMGDRYHGEALAHFGWLSPEDTTPGAKVYDYPDLFREAADALKEAELFEEAYRFYELLQLTDDYADIDFFMAMGECAFSCGRHEEAECCYLTVVELDSTNIGARVKLAKLYESLGMDEEALRYVNQAVLLGRDETGRHGRRRRRRDNRVEQLAKEFQGDGATAFRAIAPKATLDAGIGTLTTRTRIAHEKIEGEGPGHVQYLYSKMMELRPKMRQGDDNATEDWLDIADALLNDFRSNRAFYPLQRNMIFLGYSREAQRRAGKSRSMTIMDEMHAMAGRLQESLGKHTTEALAIPNDYHGISFDEWLDMFLEYAFVISGQGEAEEAYGTLAAAADASVWYHNKAKLRQIHICWFTSALQLQDEEMLIGEARWFLREYQFVTDVYRLFSMLSLLCHDPRKSVFHSSRNMKFMLRQIKAMDYTLPDDDSRPRPKTHVRESIYHERASLSTRDEHGEPIQAKEIDAAMLVLYGHILYSGNSLFPALNYFFRAYALNDRNPSVLLSIALSYINHSLKRQADNRHYLIMQGISFLQEYRRIREKSGTTLSERQEMEFNCARVWHSLGILHLAVEGYQRVLEIGEQIQAESQRYQTDGEEPPVLIENFSGDAALALQNIYAMGGDLNAAMEVTKKHLVI